MGAVAELLRQLQAAILAAADTIALWRDIALVVLAAIAIAGILLWVEGLDP